MFLTQLSTIQKWSIKMADGYELDDKDIQTQSDSSKNTLMTAEEIYNKLGCDALE